MKIEDYAFLSDTQTGALVSRDGSVITETWWSARRPAFREIREEIGDRPVDDPFRGPLPPHILPAQRMNRLAHAVPISKQHHDRQQNEVPA